jgi:hypothetical protein
MLRQRNLSVLACVIGIALLVATVWAAPRCETWKDETKPDALKADQGDAKADEFFQCISDAEKTGDHYEYRYHIGNNHSKYNLYAGWSRPADITFQKILPLKCIAASFSSSAPPEEIDCDMEYGHKKRQTKKLRAYYPKGVKPMKEGGWFIPSPLKATIWDLILGQALDSRFEVWGDSKDRPLIDLHFRSTILVKDLPKAALSRYEPPDLRRSTIVSRVAFRNSGYAACFIRPTYRFPKKTSYLKGWILAASEKEPFDVKDIVLPGEGGVLEFEAPASAPIGERGIRVEVYAVEDRERPKEKQLVGIGIVSCYLPLR